MARVSWSTQALNDIDSIAEYIALDSPRYARLQVQKFFSSVKILETFPQTGRIVPESNQSEIREVIVGGYYRIIYRLLSDNDISIITVHHSSRLLKLDKLK